MIRIPSVDRDAPILVIGVGNTNTHVATWSEARLKTPLSARTDDPAAIEEILDAHLEAMTKGHPAAAVMGSVVPAAADRIAQFIEKRLDKRTLRIGDSVPLPIDLTITEKKQVGVDRVCAAAAAYEKIQSACAVIDFGTATTVDLVNDDGEFLGGAILPGVHLQLRALADHTALLPDVQPGFPELPYGRNTTEAMQTGVCRGMAGAVRNIVEGYATSLNHWPQVVATGGDVELLSEHCDFLDILVKDLTLHGIALAYTKHLAEMGA